MFANEIAEKLINLPKKIKDKTFKIDLTNEKNIFELVCESEPEFIFLVEIKSNKKISFKISMHYQENSSKIALLRIDYKSGHQNPFIANEFVPQNLMKWLGYKFNSESHMHLYIQGYKDLAWAIPLNETDFPIFNIDSNSDFISAIKGFAKKINIENYQILPIQETLL